MTSDLDVALLSGDHDPELADLEVSPLPFSVVGIGASAGGMGALQRFFEQMPRETGMAFVVILHLSPRHESNAAAILQRSTRMPVLQVVETVRIEVDHVYVIPPTRHLSMSEANLRLLEPERVLGRQVAIDVFFRTLAAVHRERAVAVVLSGTGADGAVGLSRVKEKGGITFVQTPEDAEYDGMPRAAIATGSVDFVMPVIEMPQRMVELVANSRRIQLPAARGELGLQPLPDPSPEAETALRDIKSILKARTGHDFSHYKRATVLRRIERRLQVNALTNLPDYRQFLTDSAQESVALLQDLLISVTNFFRDREAFEALERDVLPALYADRRSIDPIRVWVTGCATGEEAYSIAMLLSEMSGSQADAPDFQIFATDIDERALAVGRAGLYPLSIATDVPPSRLRRFFAKEENQYHVSKSLRERVLFARHNVLRDPPFSRIDLVCCRNLLIYVDRDAQRHILDVFRFSLRSSGYIFLGSSESPDVVAQTFDLLDQKHRIYRVNPLAAPPRHVTVLHESVGPLLVPQAPPKRQDRRDTRFETLHQEAMEVFSPPSALIDASHQILHLSSGAGRFLEHSGGVPSHNLVSIVHPELRLELRTALFKADQTGKSVEARTVQMRRDSQDMFVNIIVRPFKSKNDDAKLTVVIFDEVEDTMRPTSPAGDGSQAAIVDELEAELKRQKEHLQDSLEQAETTTEELKASNEELQAINEELRSTTEELETGKEELQSMNEELITVNFELKVKIEETAKINDDLQNLIASTDIATVFIDNNMRIQRYTPRALDIFSLIPTDIGRSLLDIRHGLAYDQLADDAAEAFRSLRLIEREVTSKDGHVYLARVLPYRTTADRIDGATLSFISVTNLRRAEQRAREGEAHLHLAAATTRDFAIMTMDEAGLITTWNKGAERIFGYPPEEIIGQHSSRLFTPEDRAAGVPEKEITTARTSGRAEDDRWHLRKDNTRFFCSGVVTPFESGKLSGFAKIARDITGTQREQLTRDALLLEEQAVRAQYEAASRLKDEFLAVMSHELKHPLNLIHVNAELLTRMPQVRALPAVERAAQVIKKTVISQGKIIDDLLDLSRVRTGKLTLHVVAADLAATVETIVAAVRADAAAKNIALEYHADPDLGAVACDPVRAEQIVWNLLSNALKFTPEGGRIDVRLEADGPDAKLEVTDTGKGIAAGFLPHVFDMFGQEHSSPNRHDSGLGIGLALVRELAVAQNGRAEVQSPGVNRGATFSVWLPFHDVVRRSPHHVRALPSGSLSGLRVLVVEDSRESLEPFVELLRLEGALPEPALGGRAAIALLDAHDFDLIISDIAMPDIGGYQLIAEIRRRERFADVPAIAVTGYGRFKDKQKATEAGFDAHVTKPASIQDIKHALDELRLR